MISKVQLFPVALSRTLQQFGISNERIQSLRNLGIAAHPETDKAMTKLSSSSHSDHVLTFIESAIKNNHFMTFLIDEV